MHLAVVPLVLLLLAGNPIASETSAAGSAKSEFARVEVPAFGISHEKVEGWSTSSVNAHENLKRPGVTEDERQKHDAKTTAGFIRTINVLGLLNNAQTNI